jgi:hypothetical protein
LGIDGTGYSPRVQQKMTYAGVKNVSYKQAAEELTELADLEIKPKPIERLVKRIGRERIDQRDAAVAAHQQLPLMEKDAVAAPVRPCPAVAMVSMDGGRLQIRSTPQSESEPKPTSHWRESKTAVLETFQGEVHQADPDPDVPRCFLDLKRTAELVRGQGHALPVGLDFEGPATPTPTPTQPKATPPTGRDRKARPGRPKRLVRSVLASRAASGDFGPMMHQAARERNFFGAARRVFLGDGLAANWAVHRRHFSTFLPILDLVHALSYVFAAAFAGRSVAEGAEVFRRWIQAVWSGQVATILPELEDRCAALGSPPAECAESDPRQLVFEAWRYLRNNADRMKYDEYRRQGLPIMTSAVESAIKMINRRVKGSEKFWSEPGAEAILQLRADYLSETEPMERFWAEREDHASSSRPYRCVA